MTGLLFGRVLSFAYILHMERNYRKPDLNAPRFREKVFDMIAYPENATLCFFSRMKQKHPHLSKYTNTEQPTPIWKPIYSKEYQKNGAQNVSKRRE